jgi:hypothetical protein
MIANKPMLWIDAAIGNLIASSSCTATRIKEHFDDMYKRFTWGF